jgi:hypothetical protein
VLSFVPPEDLLRRLEVLPQSYLKQRDLHRRLRLTADPATAQASLAAALEGQGGSDGGTAWPEVHYLGPQHPVLDWLADRILYRFGREEAPVLAADVAVPTVLISGVWANKLGEPIADAWLAATVEDGMVTFEDLFVALERAGVRAGMVNAADAAREEELPALLAPIVTAAKQNLRDRLDDQVGRVRATLERTRRRLTSWQTQARALAEALPPGAHQSARRENVERVTKQIEALLQDHQPATAPLLRVVGALLPRQGGNR